MAKIFIVEDERTTVALLERVLGQLGYTIVGTASKGEEAIPLIHRNFPDLVLMDISLEGNLDGVEAANILRSRFNLPVVFLTASDKPELGRIAVTEPFGYIVKPVEERELHMAIEIALYRQKTETRLHEVERWLSTTLKSIGDAVIVTDLEHKVTFINRAAEEITGWLSEEALGQDLAAIFTLLDHKMAVENSGIPARLFENHGTLRSRNGKSFKIEHKLNFITSDDGEASGIVVVFRDVTEKFNLEAQFRQLQKMESIGQMAAGIAHDFNNSLTIIEGAVSVLSRKQELSSEAAKSLNQISTTTEKAGRLTRQLLTFSRKEILKVALVDFNEIIWNLTGMLRRLLGEDIALDFRPSPKPAMVQADVSMLEQAVMNLAVNARDAMPKGGLLLIEIEHLKMSEDQLLQPDVRPGDFVRVEFRDTGTGMDSETVSRIFEPFFTTKPPGKGTGLGLSTVYGIVKQHNGWLEVTSELRQGSSFMVHLPAAAIEQGNFDSPPSGGSAQSDGDTPPDHSNGWTAKGRETIMVVEDEEVLRDVIREIFEMNGYQVIEAASGSEALMKWEAERHNVDLLLTDIMMPAGISGTQLAKNLRQQNPHLKIILTSGYSHEAQDLQEEHGSNLQFLQKPYSPTNLLSIIRRVLDMEKTC